MLLKNTNPRLVISFLSVTIFGYLLLFFFQGRLQFTPIWDEPSFWSTSQLFSHNLIPDLNLLTKYGELNTPLPFIIFGWLEYFFKGGIFAGRLFNFSLSFLMTCIIGLPIRKRKRDSIFAVCALISFPYYLWLSSHFYTDIIATFFVLLGFCFYVRSNHIPSGICFILAIASRQFMLVFPLAIAAYEFTSSIVSKKNQIYPIRWLIPLVASLSIFGWLLLFRGLAPSVALQTKNVPDVQNDLWLVSPQSTLYFLACVGLYFVIPELVLFRPKIIYKNLITYKNILLSLTLLLLFVIFPPKVAHGLLDNLEDFLIYDAIHISLMYLLALLACLRFSSRINLAFWILLINSAVMMKAFPWDKYLLPLLVTFWYFKSIGVLDRMDINQQFFIDDRQPLSRST